MNRPPVSRVIQYLKLVWGKYFNYEWVKKREADISRQQVRVGGFIQ